VVLSDYDKRVKIPGPRDRPSLLGSAVPLSPGQDSGWTLCNNEDGLPGSPSANSIVVTPDGLVWAGTSWGLYYFDGDLFREYGPVPSNIRSMANGPGGQLWMLGGCSQEKAVYVLRNGVIDTVSFPDKTDLGPVWSLYIAVDPTGDGRIVVGTTAGLFLKTGSQWRELVSVKSVGSCAFALDGGLWYVTDSLLMHLEKSVSAEPVAVEVTIDSQQVGTWGEPRYGRRQSWPIVAAGCRRRFHGGWKPVV
jgi:hypothetical protein